MIGLVALFLVAGAQDDSIAVALRQAVASENHASMRWGDISDTRPALTAVYADRSWRPLWTVGGRATGTAIRVVTELDSAATHGLDPDDYDANWLHASINAATPLTLAAAAEYDVVLSVAVSRYLAAVHRGRVDPRDLHPGYVLPRDSMNIGLLLMRLAETARPDSLIHALEPQDAQYRILKEWLADYRALDARSEAGGSRDSLRQRIRQIELTLERRRWLPQHLDGPIIVVNVPAYQLYTLTGEGNPERELLSMDVVVGQAAGHETPQLSTSIVAVQFQPEWVVPTGIAQREIRPSAVRDPAFLDRHHYQLLRGDSVVPNTRENASRIGRGVDVRQLPGAWNALGHVKFIMPNNADIYLHDTPERLLFDRDRRDFSHGCVRVANPQALAEFVLAREPGWNTERIAAALEGDSTFVTRLMHPMPVYIVYQTLVPTEFADIIVYTDVYGEDARLDAALRRGYPYPSSSGPR